MATTVINYVGDGVSTDYTVNFTGGYLTREGVAFTVDSVPVEITWVTEGIVRFTVAPSTGSAIRIERKTNIEALVNKFRDGSVLSEVNLDESFSQLLLKLQELQNKVAELESNH